MFLNVPKEKVSYFLSVIKILLMTALSCCQVYIAKYRCSSFYKFKEQMDSIIMYQMEVSLNRI